MTADAHPAAPHPFPMWPYAFTACAQAYSQGYIDYLDRLSRADGALDVFRAEECFSLSLLTGMNEAFAALAWAAFAVPDSPDGPPP